MLHPRDGVLVLHLLLWPDEVRKPRFSFLRDDISRVPRELQAAEAYIHTLTGTLDPPDMVDRYQAALRELVEAKVAGRQLEHPAGPHADADNLMEALRRSVEQAKQDRGSPRRPAAGAQARGEAGHHEPPQIRRSTATRPGEKTTATSRSPARKATAKKSTEGR